MNDDADDAIDAEEAAAKAEAAFPIAGKGKAGMGGLVYSPGIPTLEQLAGKGSTDGALSTATKEPEPVSPLEYGEAAGAGALRGASFGLSDPALVHSGITSSEKLRELKEKTPLTSGLSEFGGNLLSVAGAEALTAGLATPELAAGEIAAKSAAMAGRGILGEAAKQAVIGSAMGAGNQISEDTLGDKETTAESLLASGLMGGLVGGGAGALVGGVHNVARPLLDSVAEKTDALGATLKDFAEAHGANPKASLEKGVSTLTDNLQDVADVQKKTGQVFHGADQDGLRYQEQEELTKALDPTKVRAAADSVLDDIAGPVPVEPEPIATPASTGALPSKDEMLAQVAEAKGDLRGVSAPRARQASSRAGEDGVQGFNLGLGNASNAVDPVEEAKAAASLPFKSTAAPVPTPPEDNSLLAAMKGDRLVEPRVSGKAEDILGGLREDLQGADTPADVMSAVRDTRRQLRDLKEALGGTTDVGKNTALGYINDIDSSLKAHLENPEVFGAAAGREASVNQSIAQEMDATKGMIDAGLAKKIKTAGQAGFDVEIKPSAVRGLARDLVAGKPEAQAKMEAIGQWVDAIKAKGSQISTSAASVPTSESGADLKTLLLQQAKQMAEVQGNTAKVQQLQEALQAVKPSSGIIQGLLARHIGDKAAEVVTHPVEGLSTLADMMRATAKVTNKINRGVSSFLGTNIGRDAIPVAMSHTLESSSWSGKRQNSKDDRRTAYQARRSEILALQSDPEKFTNQIVSRTGKIHNAAPATSGLLAMKASTALGHIASQLNPQSDSQDLLVHTTKRTDPSEVEMDKLETAHRVVTKPLSVLDSMRAGTLTNDEVNTLKTVYPKLYSQMASAMMNKLANSREPVPYANRLQISTFIGRPADASQLPQNFAMLQSNFANDMTQDKAAPMAGKKHQNSARVADMGLSEANQTPFQKAVGA